MHRIGYVLTEGFQVLALATQSVFEFANLVAGEPFYEVEKLFGGGWRGSRFTRSRGWYALRLMPSARRIPGYSQAWSSR